MTKLIQKVGQIKDKPFFSSLAISLFMHTAVICFLVFNFIDTPIRASHGLLSPPPIVHAVTVNSEQVDAELSAIKKREQQKQQAERARLKQQEQQAQEALQKKRQAQADLVRLKKELEKQEKQRLTAQAQKVKMQRELEALRKKQAAEQLAADAKQVAEKKRKEEALAQKQAAVKAAQQAKAQAAEQKRITQEAEAALQQAAEQEQQQRVSQEVQREIDRYKVMIIQAISQNWLLPSHIDRSQSCELFIRLAPGGTVLEVRLQRSSGNAALDRSAQAAVLKASPLPVPKDLNLFERFHELSLTVKPEKSVS